MGSDNFWKWNTRWDTVLATCCGWVFAALTIFEGGVRRSKCENLVSGVVEAEVPATHLRQLLHKREQFLFSEIFNRYLRSLRASFFG